MQPEEEAWLLKLFLASMSFDKNIIEKPGRFEYQLLSGLSVAERLALQALGSVINLVFPILYITMEIKN